MRGRPPKPKHILELTGSKHAKGREELGTAPATMQPPEWLKPRAKVLFGRLVEWLTKMGTLAETDEHVLIRYCVVYVMWEYVEVTAPDGSLRFSRATGVATQAKECGEQLRHLETVLGLTPADRTRLGYGAVKVVADPVDALFGDAAAG